MSTHSYSEVSWSNVQHEIQIQTYKAPATPLLACGNVRKYIINFFK